MKKIIIALAVAAMATGTLQAQNVTIKRGKVTMSEADYKLMKEHSDRYEIIAQKLVGAQRKIDQLEAQTTEIKTFNDSASYAIGKDMYAAWSRQKLGVNYKAVAQSLIDCANDNNVMSDNMVRTLLQRFQMDFERRQAEALQNNIKAGQEWLTENRNNKSVFTTPSGLQYKKIKDGNGKRPTASDRVKVHYTGRLIDGTIFDSSVQRGEPIEFALNQVIKGWTEGLQLMDEGSKYMLFIPYELAYGERDMGNIPGGSALVFEVELLEIHK